MQYKKIIFVSEENTYTSPVAEAIMKDKLKREGLSGVEVESCGRVVLFCEPANPKAIAIAKARGVEMEQHRAVSIEGSAFGSDVLILVMTEKIKLSLYETYTQAMNVYTIKEFVGETGDIDTPYGKGMKEYGEVFNQLDELTDKVIKKLFINNI